MEQRDRAGHSYWESLWTAQKRTRAIGARPLTYAEQRQAAAFDSAFRRLGDPAGKRLIEIGCGDSGWLPYFAKHWRLRVTGIDYSAIGCENAINTAASENVQAEIVCADLFRPPAELNGSFDAAVSIGVVEHFEDTAGVLHAIGRFVRPGGLVVTMIPNMASSIGALQKLVNRAVYDIHVPLDAPALASAHEHAGLEVLDCRYLMALNLGVVNTTGVNRGRISRSLRHLLLAGFVGASRAVWKFEQLVRPLPETRMFSPYIFVVARRRE